jgi:hypothetical protein
MKRQIRSSVFETNSSSTHSIAISKAPVIAYGKYIYFGIGEYGWENGTANTANYLYTAILYVYSSEVAEEKIEHLKRILDKYDISYEFEEPEYWISSDGSAYLDNGYIDHGCELTDFLEAVLSNEDLLMRYLFGNSTVYTGNDNQDHEPSGCNISSAEYYDWGASKWVANPYYDPENYEYFYKGN